MPNYIVITVSADGLASSGAKAFVGTVMDKLGSLVYKGAALEGYNWSLEPLVQNNYPIHIEM